MILRLIMRIFRRSLLFWILILCACSTSLIPTDTVQLDPASPPPTATELTPETFPDSPGLPIPRFAQTPPTPHIDQPPSGNEVTITPANVGCGYQWAYKDLPDLSGIFLQAIQQFQPSAQANAFAFGEDCVYADGHANFIAMETDFNITLQATDLTDANECGEWIVKVMQVILDLPKEEIMGPRPGKGKHGFSSRE